MPMTFVEQDAQIAAQIAGGEAATDGRPITDCPFQPGDPEGPPRRQGWIRGESSRRYFEGSFGVSEEEHQAAARMIHGGRSDPTAILDDTPSADATWPTEFTIRHAPAMSMSVSVTLPVDVAA